MPIFANNANIGDFYGQKENKKRYKKNLQY